jgi:5-methylcytosine-specific restriction endonuclease McrA
VRPLALLEPRVLPVIRALIRRWYVAAPLPATDRRSMESDFHARWRRILFADPCPYCGGAVETIDHILARSRGGTDHWTNVTGACRACNRAKRDLPLLIFLMRRRPARPRRFVRQRLGLFADRLAAALADGRETA